MDMTTIDISQIIGILSDKTTMIVLYGACAVLALLLLLLNWKKKRFLIYWAVVCLPVGALLYDLKNIAQIGANQVAVTYGNVVSLVTDTLFVSMHNVGLGLMVAGCVFIVLYIINGIVEGKKA